MNEPYEGMTHEVILETLSDAINELDASEKYGMGDELFNVIIALKIEWGIPLEG